MAALNLSVKHGQSFEVARANFEKGITRAAAKYGSYIQRIDWSDDRSEARLNGSGCDVRLTVDAEAVHATGQVPFYFKMFEGRVKQFVQEALASP